MSTENCDLPILDGWSVEIARSKLILNVRDNTGAPMSGATVTTDCSGNISSTITDAQGCASIIVDNNQRCTLTISQPGFENYITDFFVGNEGEMTDPTNTFVCRVEDNTGAPISGATVSIVSGAHSDSGSTAANGTFEGEVRPTETNDITISAAGFSDYTTQFTPYTPIMCENEGFRVVPVIVLNP